MATEQALLEILERLQSRFYGKYRGAVVEVEESGRGRIKAKVPSVLGEQTTGWCDPCVPYAGDGVGFVFLPEVGAGVWIEFEGGDVSYPIWVGCYWRDGELPAGASSTKKMICAQGNTLTLDSSGVTVNDGGLQVKVK